MLKFFLDKLISVFILFIFSPIILVCLILVFAKDYSNPIYISKRVGKNFVNFNLLKIRSMINNADKSGISSTSINDKRITSIGKFIRRFKIDEVLQLVNVIKGDMSLVGPRPQIPSEVDLYSESEKNLLSIKPGITDFSSIIFSDEGEILKDSLNPNQDYNILIRPWKSKLGIFYINNRDNLIDIQLLFLTVLSIFKRKLALKSVSNLLKKINAEVDLVNLAKRECNLRKLKIKNV
jgi:lipopolysaccharide/colanic/teichoic acid biosynthesis glycosyltransferase